MTSRRYFSIQTLVDAGIKKIIIVPLRGHAGNFIKLLKSVKAWGC